jgi:hypothetical protein
VAYESLRTLLEWMEIFRSPHTFVGALATSWRPQEDASSARAHPPGGGRFETDEPSGAVHTAMEGARTREHAGGVEPAERSSSCGGCGKRAARYDRRERRRRHLDAPDVFLRARRPELGAPAGGTRLPIARETRHAPRADDVKAARRAPAQRVVANAGLVAALISHVRRGAPASVQRRSAKSLRGARGRAAASPLTDIWNFHIFALWTSRPPAPESRATREGARDASSA